MNAYERIKHSAYEYWLSFLDNVPNLLLGLIVLILAILISRWISSFFKNTLAGRMDDPLLSNFISRILRNVLIILGILLAFHIMGFTGIAGSLLAGAGVGALIIGLAFQEIGANFLAGIILAFNRPFNVGDTVEIDNFMGKVVKLNIRITQIKTFDGKDIYIPNSKLIKNVLINYTRDGFLRMSFMVGIDYEDDIGRAQEIILNAIKKVDSILQSDDRKPMVQIKELGVSTVNLNVFFWVETFDYKRGVAELKSEVIKQVLIDLRKSSIGLPADIIELKYYKDNAIPVKFTEKSGKP